MRESLLHHPNQPPTTLKKGAALLGTFATLLQIFRLYCGTGLLAFPYAVKCGGLLLAPITLSIIGGLNNYTLRMLVHCKRHVTSDLTLQLPSTLDDLAYVAFGKIGRQFTSIAMVLSLLGLCSGYLIFVGKTLQSSFGNPAWSIYLLHGIDVNLFTVLATFLALPLTMIRNYNKVQWTSILGNLSLVAAIVVVLYHVIVHIIHPTPTPSPISPSSLSPSSSSPFSPVVPPSVIDTIKLTNLDELPVFLGLVFFAFAVQGVILGVEASTAKPKQFLRLLDWGAVIGVGLYSSFGCLAYYSYGSTTSQIIFKSIASDENFIDLRIVEVLFCLSMILLYPMQLVPVVQIFERWFNIQDQDLIIEGVGETGRVGTAFSPFLQNARSVDPKTGDRRLSAVIRGGTSSDRDNEDENGTNVNDAMCSGKSCCLQNVLRCTLTVLTGSFAILFGDVFSQILSIVGALGFSLLSFILPPLIYMKIFGNELTCCDKMFSICILTIGLAGMSISTVIDAKSIVAYFQGNTTDPCA